ncbi:putative general stress protein 26 [Sulfitobacter noctilucae]|uniref:pyridoxamine 5'-phosphate oxidase family protein n=1 Tax=Sulfitobacter noctilucae TaxID=1342302 RepID=UPI000468560B|nr:pyridoxamine 5'-phosphate oxidase family protein [Sulfitobacter noctilucae]KIN61428.1 putative general stress protein 26 [Sulfitobacter noctilucae]
MTDHIKKEFLDRLEDTRVGMLSAGNARAVPMSHYFDDDDPKATLWFITAKQTDLSQVAATGAEGTFIASSNNESLYARVNGTLSVSQDKAKLDEIWNKVASAWFEGDQRDPDVQLLRFDPSEAEVWITGGSLKFIYEIAKANLTGSKPDMGDHAVLRF